jgi:hypothetical protein
MPRLISRNPRYCRHCASGQAVTAINGTDFYLGLWKSKASREEYDHIIGEYLANGRRLPGVGESDIYIAELAERFWEHAQAYYKRVDGTYTGEASCFRAPLDLLVRLYGRHRRDFPG